MDLSKFKREYKLKQHTPLIHFQFEDFGATLRATEVKPKLDKFVLKKQGGIAEIKASHPNWFLGDSDALNYKMRFTSTSSTPIELGKGDYDIYYGNMGAKDNKKVKAVLSDYVEMTILCFDEELIEFVDKCVAEFFIVTNFGRMQSKGFGSYSVVSKDGSIMKSSDIAKALKSEYNAKRCYTFPSSTPFKDIKSIYGVMKSGINFRRLYRRSLLFQYMHTLFIGNEKAKLKSDGIAPVVYKSRTPRPSMVHNEKVHYYVRALLGVGDHLDFINELDFDDRQINGKTNIKISNENIERYNSTVFFKIISNQVFFVGKRIDKELFGQKFKFANNKNSIVLSTPPYDTVFGNGFVFDENFMDGFLDFAVKQLNINGNQLGSSLSDILCRAVIIKEVD